MPDWTPPLGGIHRKRRQSGTTGPVRPVPDRIWHREGCTADPDEERIMNIRSEDPPRLPPPAETLVVSQDGEVLLVLDGVVVLPIGSRVELTDDDSAAVVGIRLTGISDSSPQLILDVDSGGSSFEMAAIREAENELGVVAAAEEITGQPSDREAESASE
jgi:hypothetical protein